MEGKYSHKCPICGSLSGFFVWSTDRRFNRKKLAEICNNIPENKRIGVLTESYTVCLGCVREHGLMK